MEKNTSITIIAIIALLLSVVAIGYAYLSQPEGVDLSSVELGNSNNKIEISKLQKDIANCNADISNLDLDCSCGVDEDDFYDLEDDISDLEDDFDDLLESRVDGVDGIDGIDGTNGSNGIDGVNGVDGINGIDGIDGTNGVDGIDGADGSDADCLVVEDLLSNVMNCYEGDWWNIQNCINAL